ncbi:MAG: hypothetical protein ACRDRL_17260, partial [Sciscionella sp.]
ATHRISDAIPLYLLAAACFGMANPALDAGRLDIIPSRLWGRAEAIRTLLRSGTEALAPLLFGFVSGRFGAEASRGVGMRYTFMIMVFVVMVAAVLLLVMARRHYPRDVATALATERNIQRSAEVLRQRAVEGGPPSSARRRSWRGRWRP